MTHPSILFTILTEALKATPQNLSAEERLKDIESRKVALEEEIAKLKQDIEAENTPWRPKPGKEVWMFMPACDRPIQIAAFDPDRAFHAHSFALGHVFKTEEEATRMWNGQVIDNMLRNHPQRVKEREFGVEYFCLRHDPVTTYVSSDTVSTTVVSQRLGGLLFISQAALEDVIAELGQDALRDYVAYCAR